MYATENVRRSARVAGVDLWWIRGWYDEHIRVCRCGNHRHGWPDPAPSKMSRRNTPACFGSTTTGVRHSYSDVAHPRAIRVNASECGSLTAAIAPELENTSAIVNDRTCNSLNTP